MTRKKLAKVRKVKARAARRAQEFEAMIRGRRPIEPEKPRRRRPEPSPEDTPDES